MRRSVRLSIFVLIQILAGIVITWTTEISTETQAIPTIVNGIASTIALVVGLNLTAIAVLISRLSEYHQETTRIVDYAFLLYYPISMLLYSYFELMIGEYHSAFRFAFTGLVASLSMFLPSVVYFGAKLSDQIRKQKELNKNNKSSVLTE